MYLLDEHPSQLTIPELCRALYVKSRDFESNYVIERTVRNLAGCGLLNCEGPFVVPTKAALLHAVGDDLSRAAVAARFGREPHPRLPEPRRLERSELIPRPDTAIQLAGAVGTPLDAPLTGIAWTQGSARVGVFAGPWRDRRESRESNDVGHLTPALDIWGVNLSRTTQRRRQWRS